MKYILYPFLKYLGLSIKLILQILLAIIITLIWGIPTLIWSILYFLLVSLWEFKICYYKLNTCKIKWDDDSIIKMLLWSKIDIIYKTYFHCIWNLNSKPIMVQIINKIKKQLNLN